MVLNNIYIGDKIMNSLKRFIKLLLIVIFILLIPKNFVIGDTASPTGTVAAVSTVDNGVVLTTEEPSENVIKFEVRKIKISTDPITYAYNILDVPIYEMTIEGVDNKDDVLSRLELLKNRSKSIDKSVPGSAYKNINIFIESKIESATIKYKIENSWINNNNILLNTIAMYMWDRNDRKWEELSTSLSYEDGRYTYFESTTESLSYFVISGLAENVNIVDNSDADIEDSRLYYPEKKSSTKSGTTSSIPTSRVSITYFNDKDKKNSTNITIDKPKENATTNTVEKPKEFGVIRSVGIVGITAVISIVYVFRRKLKI